MGPATSVRTNSVRDRDSAGCRRHGRRRTGFALLIAAMLATSLTPLGMTSARAGDAATSGAKPGGTPLIASRPIDPEAPSLEGMDPTDVLIVAYDDGYRLTEEDLAVVAAADRDGVTVAGADVGLPVDAAGVVAAVAAGVGGIDVGGVERVFSARFVLIEDGDVATAAASIEEHPAVVNVTRNRLRESSKSSTRRVGSERWGLDRLDHPNRTAALDSTYRFTTTGKNTLIYVIDSGIDLWQVSRSNSAELPASRIEAWYTGYANSSGDDCDGHGTHVASTAAGTGYGVASGARIISINAEASDVGCGIGFFTLDLLIALDFVPWHRANRGKNRPAVVNMSLGGPKDPGDPVDAAVSNVIASGIPVVAAAGNDDEDACLSSPAWIPAAITVGATTVTDARASFSNFGTCLDVFAPGVDIWAAGWDCCPYFPTVVPLSGTSMAAPHVTGLVSRYLEANPRASTSQVAAAIVGGAASGVVDSPGVGSPDRLLNSSAVERLAPSKARGPRLTKLRTGRGVKGNYSAKGTPPFTWAIVSGSLPSGVSLNPSSGAVSGASANAGSGSVTVRGTDVFGRTIDVITPWVVN
jgi:hypothetical protein